MDVLPLIVQSVSVIVPWYVFSPPPDPAVLPLIVHPVSSRVGEGGRHTTAHVAADRAGDERRRAVDIHAPAIVAVHIAAEHDASRQASVKQAPRDVCCR